MGRQPHRPANCAKLGLTVLPELLFLAHRIPYPPDKGDKIRSWHFLSHLAKQHTVHLACFVDDPPDWEHAPRLREICEKCYFAELGPLAVGSRGLSALTRGESVTVASYRDKALGAWVRDLLARRRLDSILVYSAAMAQYVMAATETPVRRVIDFVDVDSDKWRQYAETRAWPLSWLYRRESRRLLDLERGIAAAFEASIFVSSAEAALFRSLVPECAGKVFHLANGVDPEYFSPDRTYENPYAPAMQALIFIGAMDYWPNVDAARWFAARVLPRVRKSIPEAHFYVVGSSPGLRVRRLDRLPGVTVTGRVDDVRPYLAHAAAAVAPLRVSRGVQNKILEAMAMAKPVVATPQALEGIEAEAGQEVLVASDADSFAREIVDLVRSNRHEEIGRRARARVRADHDWSASLAYLDSLL